MDLPYDDIIETCDRAWTFRLLARLAEPVEDDERRKLVRALGYLSDPRAVALLEAMLTDASLPRPQRETAGEVLRRMDFVDPGVTILRRWWASGDEVLARHTLRSMSGLECPDIVQAVASDAAHPFQADALDRMEFWFDTAEGVAIRVAALSHPAAEVRIAAADVLMWDELLAGEGPLIRATADSSPIVAAVAARTLKYYPSLAVLRCLEGLRDHSHPKVREQAEEGFAEIRDGFAGALRRSKGDERRRLRRWMKPFWKRLAFTEDELRLVPPVPGQPLVVVREAIPLNEVLALIADENASPRLLGDALGECDWLAFKESERDVLRTAFLPHPDPVVRSCSCSAFAEWQDSSAFQELLDDPAFGIRKTAMYHLGRLPPDPRLARVVWDYLAGGRALGTHLTEALLNYVKHADQAEAVPRLAAIAADPAQRECLRTHAVGYLGDFGATEEIARLAWIIAEPPLVTWALHLAVLEAFKNHSLPLPSLDHLRGIDNLHLRSALAAI